MKSVLHRTNRCLTIFQTQVAVWACATWMVAATTCFAQAQQDYDVFSEINPPSTIQQGNQLGFVSPSNQVSFVDELTLDQVPLPQALALISKQTDLKLLASAEARNVEISLDVREMNAIDLLRVMTRVNGLWYQHDKDTNIYMIFADKEAKPQDLVLQIALHNYSGNSTRHSRTVLFDYHSWGVRLSCAVRRMMLWKRREYCGL